LDLQVDKRQGRRRFAIGAGAAVAAVAALSLLAGPSGAQSVDELNSQISGAQAEADTLGAEIEAKTAQLGAARQQAAVAAAREARLTSVLAAGEQREAELGAQVTEAQAELAAARARLRRALDVLADRLIAIFKGDAPDETALLLDSDGFDDLATRADLLGRIQAADAGLAMRVRALREAIADHLAAVRVARARQDAFNDQVAGARDRIAAARAAAEAQAAALAEARAAQAAALEGLQSQVASWEHQLQQQQQMSAAQAHATVAGWFGDWAIPQAIVMCESGGNYGALNPSSGAGGAYQILPSTWRLYGGSGSPHSASRGEQDRIASQIWADSGSAAWVCAH
jgi:hypothetical protein